MYRAVKGWLWVSFFLIFSWSFARFFFRDGSRLAGKLSGVSGSRR